MGKIGILSDTHLTLPEFESESLFMNRLEWMSEQRAREEYEKMRVGFAQAFEKVRGYLEKEKWEMIVHLGDVCGGYKMEGISHSSGQRICREAVRDLNKVCRRTRYCLGNHDLGYGSWRKKGGGLNLESVLVAKEIFGKLFWEDEIEGVLHVGLCSPLIEYDGGEKKLLGLKTEQENFFKAVLGRNERVVVYLHDAGALEKFKDVLGLNLHKVDYFVQGHLHDPRVMWFLRFGSKARSVFYPSARNRFLYSVNSRSYVCPGVAPAWYKGQSLLEFDGIKMKKVDLSKEGDKIDLKIGSAVRAFLWWAFPHRNVYLCNGNNGKV